MPITIEKIVQQYAQQIKNLFGTALKKIIVYGSYARGDYQENSDIDIMVLVSYDDEMIHQLFYSVCDLAFDYEMKYGIVISPLVKNEAHFIKWSETLPFYKNIKNEGVVISE